MPMNSPAPRSLAHESPGAALALGRGMLATALMMLVDCAKIAVSQDRTFEDIVQTTQRQNFSPWQREVSATTTGGRVVIQTKESRQCDVLTTRTGEQVTTVYRTNETVHL